MPAHVCQKCSGPCRVHAGSAHGWTCRACLQDYIDRQPDASPQRINTVARQAQPIEETRTPARKKERRPWA